jgi:hypothetical protein
MHLNYLNYYKVTQRDKRSLISESVPTIQIDVHPAGKKPGTHDIRAPVDMPRMATFHKAPMRLKSLRYIRDEVLVSIGIVRTQSLS